MNTAQEALLAIKEHVVEVTRDGNRTLRVKCDSSKEANEMIYNYGVLYGFSSVDDAGFHFLNVDKYAYPRFDTHEMREDALEMTQTLIDGGEVTFEGSGAITVGSQGVQVDPNPNPVTVEADEPEVDSDKGLQLGTTAYIIIGAAVAIIILVLWDRKRK